MMIDPIQIPILLKAIDFVFDEGRKILEERRERRKANESASAETKTPELEKKEIIPLEPQKAEEIKQELSTSKVDEKMWKLYEWEVEKLVGLLEIHTKNYYYYKEQFAKWGSDLAPAKLMHNITDTEDTLIETRKRLEVVLSKVYNKNIQNTE